MHVCIFTDELKIDDIENTLDILRSWGVAWVDLRNRFYGKAFHDLDAAELSRLRGLLDARNMRVACLESSLAKVHLPDDERCRAESEKLEGIIRAADAMDCRLVRSFFYWQPPKDNAEAGRLHENQARLEQVLDMYAPLAERAKQAGLTLAFENCGVATWEVTAFLKALKQPHTGLAWDVRNCWETEKHLRAQDEEQYVADNTRQTLIVHVKAAGALPGQPDSIPYEKLLPAMARLGYDGCVSVETHNRNPDISHEDISKQVFERLRACIAPK